MPCHTVLYRNYTICPSGHTIKIKRVALYKEVEAEQRLFWYIEYYNEYRFFNILYFLAR